VLVYLAIVAATLVVAVVGEGTHGRWHGGALLLALASLGLAGGIWAAWLFLTVVAVGDILFVLLAWPRWWLFVVALNGAMLALLLAGPTRRHARRGRPRFAGPNP
jgi:hypothetical protein